jgi:hypothetical protein
MQAYKHDRYVNFGCGSGLLDRHLLREARGILIDHVSVLWDDVRSHPNLEKFIETSLFEDFEPLNERFGVSTDVMEHIPPEKVDVVLKNIADRVETCFFQISLNPSGDKDEAKYGGHLHLTVETPEWWKNRLTSWFGNVYQEKVDTLPPSAPWEPTKQWYVAVASHLTPAQLRESYSRLNGTKKASS